MKVPWLIKYMMSMPDEMCVRCVIRPDFPTAGSISYVIVPFDLANNVALTELGMLKIKSGVISPLAGEPGKCVLYSLDMVNLSMMPSWGMSMMLKSVVMKQMTKMVSLFKASDYCQQKYG